ncbi:MAG: YbhB/YbcL family Raf kinase inhibitor-like protein [Proteobacteria bacterium]|nr:YbhB/YbcL family Raf kinase inhibitor-like protein [Pseudomonadota bacterium]MBU1709604.1 YbhB/YbcL family Raf kinase inhibitor-like protein [Pseudomonadota bacterium]
MKKMYGMIICCVFFFVQNSFAGDFTLSSPQLIPDGRMSHDQVYSGFGCDGKNISPELNWKNAPANTKSFAVNVYDPDAPTGSGWWHWVVFNVPGDVNQLKEDAGNVAKGLAPAGSIQSRTDYGQPGYGGACPPAGDKPHRYHFTVYALDVVSLPLNVDSSAALVGFYLNSHAIDKARLTVHYSR